MKRTKVPRPRTARRPARLFDAHELALFERRVFTRYYAPHRFSEATFRYYLARPQTIAYVVQVQGAIVGYVLGVQRRGRWRDVGRLFSIGVDRRHRCRGVGSSLVRAFNEEARRRGCGPVFLEVATVNANAIRVFSRSRFSTVARLPRYYSASIDGFRMRVIL